MKKFKIFNMFDDGLSSLKVTTILSFLFFSLLFTLILSSKYFLFENLITSDNTSKKDIIATKTIEVVDTFKTEQQKKEVAMRIEPILTPAEDNYIKNNLTSLVELISSIRKKEEPVAVKKEQLNILFDLSDDTQKAFVINFFLTVSDDNFNLVTLKSKQILNSVLSEGVTEKDFERQNIARIIIRNTGHDVTRNQVRVISALLEQVIMPNMVVDEHATELAKKNAINSVQPYKVSFHKGEKIVFEGEPITKLKRDALSKAGYHVLDLNYQGFIGIFCLVTVGILSLLYYLQFFEKSFLNRNYISLMTLMSLFVIVCAVLLPDGMSVYLIPFPAFAIILAIFTNPRVSFLTSILLITMTALTLKMDAVSMAIFIIVALVSTVSVARIKYSRRYDLIKTGFEVSLVIVLLILSAYLLEKCLGAVDGAVLFRDTVSGLSNGILSGIIALGTLPLLEKLFKIITPYGLMELADVNQPLLSRLSYEARGTYDHSWRVSQLCEAAAEAIGADSILAKVGALYHDIGKLVRPYFFIENQSYGFLPENPHERLNPKMSKMIITAHTRDGLEIARENGLPLVIQNFIIQHHGDSLAGHFYNKAVEEEGAENVSESQFRYTGPKPNTKETTILMLADVVESASRTLNDHSQEALDSLIDTLFKAKLADGQLSDSPLTQKDLKIIAATFSRLLSAAYHQRIKYHQSILLELENKMKSRQANLEAEAENKNNGEEKND
ncbi:HDIG domain-containing protein [bacterium]|nr:HDIG domain-containing protein [bacterium]